VAQQRLYRLIGADGRPYLSVQPGKLGGHRRLKGYGRLDCPSALRWIAKGYYVRHRVFFADEATAVAAGYRPCAICMPEAYRAWKAAEIRSEWLTASAQGHPAKRRKAPCRLARVDMRVARDRYRPEFCRSISSPRRAGIGASCPLRLFRRRSSFSSHSSRSASTAGTGLRAPRRALIPNSSEVNPRRK